MITSLLVIWAADVRLDSRTVSMKEGVFYYMSLPE